MSPQPNEVRLHALDYLQILKNRFPVILLVFCLVFITAVAVTHLMPEKYLGKATVEIVQNDDDLKLFRNGGGADFAALNFVTTQFEVISSPQSLYRVVDDLGLVDRWNTGTRNAAMTKLRKSLETSARRNTNLVDIEVYADDPEEAAELANAVTDSYAFGRQEDESKRIEKGLGALDDELFKQRDKVSKLRTEKLRLMRENNIVDMGGQNSSATGEAVTSSPSVLANSEQRLFELRRQIEQLKTQTEKLNELTGDELVKMAISMNVADASVTQVYPQYLERTIAFERQSSLGIGPRHPKMIALQNEIAKIKEYLDSGVGTIRDTLATELKIATDSLTRIEQLHQDKKDETLSEREDFVVYADAKSEYERQNALLQSMEANFHQVKIDKNMTSTPIRIQERAEADHNPAKPIVMLNLILGGIVGLGMGLALAFFLEYLDTSVKTIEDVESLLDVPVLAVVPKDVGLLMHHPGGNSPDAEAYRILRTNLEFNRSGPEANVITGVSGSAGEGKSTTITNLAYVCAEAGYTTLLIDADLRRPNLHRNFGCSNEVGLSNFLATDMRPEQAVMRTQNANLWFIASGGMPTDPAGLLNSKKMSEFIGDMKQRFDFIFIDSPPILGVSDASVLSREADLTMVVVQHRKLPQKTLIRVKQAVESAGGNLVGVVLNNVDIRSDSQYQYYTSYYSYYSTPQDAPTVQNPVMAHPQESIPQQVPPQPQEQPQQPALASAQAASTPPPAAAEIQPQVAPSPHHQIAHIEGGFQQPPHLQPQQQHPQQADAY